MKLWGGRFSGKTDVTADAFHSSLPFDKRLYRQDINGSMAHAEMLGKQGIIPKQDAELIIAALNDILTDIERGSLTDIKGGSLTDNESGSLTDIKGGSLSLDTCAEDIHSFVESELISRIGDAGRRLHTGRSRNDQVALDMRMYVKDEIDEIHTLIINLLEALLTAAKQHTKTIMPGFTHMQKAQPITLAHHLMAYFQMFRRDYKRLGNCRELADEMPLGSGALAATTYPLDREFVMEKLGFSAITKNSLDAVSDRDFCVEFVSCLSIVMMHLSRFCEELILWSTDAFDFVEISDSYATGSSIMPQKKNPDMAELIRGKTGRVYGSLTGLLTTMKGLPLAYNKDMQEDKEAVFDATDTAKSCLSVFCGMLQSIGFKPNKMYKSAMGGYTNATDAADWLVKKGVAFRNAHEIIGKLVLYAIDKKTSLNDLTLDELKSVSDMYAIDKKASLNDLTLNELKSMSNIFDETVYEAISVEACVNARNIPGGPAESTVLKEIENSEKWLKEQC